MGDDQDRTVPSDPRSPADGVTRVDELLKQLDRLDLDRMHMGETWFLTSGQHATFRWLPTAGRLPTPGRPPASDAARGLGELMDWMAEEQPTPPASTGRAEDRTDAVEHLRVLVMGAPGAGKTALVKAVADHATTGVFVRTGGDRTGRGTGPVRYLRSIHSTTLDDGLRMELYDLHRMRLYDPHGEGESWSAWDEIAQDAQGAVVLVDPGHWQDSFPWLDYVEHRGLPYVVALNMFAGAHACPPDEIREALDLRPDCPVVTCDARDRRSAIGVLRELSARIRPNPLFTELAIGERHNGD